MRHSTATRYTAFACSALSALVLASCTLSQSTEHFNYSRAGDTLVVQLSPSGQARWDPALDSLVITCTNCDTGSARTVEKFEENWGSVYTIDPEANLHLAFNYLGREESVDLPGIADTLKATHNVRHVPHHNRRTNEVPDKPDVTVKKPAEKPVATAPARPKSAHSVKVTAPEGVAVYKDKSKTAVLKILPTGTNISLLAREGDLYSVMVDGQEGFVEAEAVQINE